MHNVLYTVLYRLTGSDLHSEVMIRYHIFFFAKCFCSFVLTFFIFKFFSLHTYSTMSTYIYSVEEKMNRSKGSDRLTFYIQKLHFRPEKGYVQTNFDFWPFRPEVLKG